MGCVACGKGVSFFGQRKGYVYARCTSCKTLQIEPQPTAAFLREAYAEYSAAGHFEADPAVLEGVQSNHYGTLAKILRDYGVKGKVLDYGAGWGGLTRRLRAEGFDAQGVDLEPHMAAYAQEQGLPVIRGDLDDVTGGPFAALALCTVFEHLVDHDAWLQRARTLLAPAGLFVTLQPTASFAATVATLLRWGKLERPLPELYQLFSPPWHTVLFSVAGMEHLFARNGFRLEAVHWARSSREPGALRWIQMVLERVHRVAWALLGTRWPFQVCHVFVFRKTGE